MKRVKQCTSAAFFMVLSFSVLAHPHSFISLKTEVVADNGLLTGFKMRWTMDEITSADLLYDAGKAKPGDEVWKKLAAEVMANVLGQHYFSELWHNGQRVKFDNRPDGYGLEREGHQAVLTFTLPLINAARCVLFLATAKGKEASLARALGETPDPAAPASLVRPKGELIWFIVE